MSLSSGGGYSEIKEGTYLLRARHLVIIKQLDTLSRVKGHSI